MTIYDITRPVDGRLAVWPGDTPYRFDLVSRLADGETANVGAVATTVHAGTHADAPFHLRDGGAAIGALDLEPFLGPAVVVDVTGQAAIGPEFLKGIDLARTPRVLLRTGGWPDASRFPERIPALTVAAADALAAGGASLVGVDVPSVDAIDSHDLPIHHALDRAGIRILESLLLDGVPAGEYRLIALPLRLMEADGSPLRAVLTPLAVE